MLIYTDSHIMPVSSKELLDIKTTKKCTFTLNGVRDMIRTHS